MLDARTVTLVSGDDWSGLYIDGALVTEGHSVSARDALEVVAGVGPFRLVCEVADQEWLESEGNLPAKLADVRLAA